MLLVRFIIRTNLLYHGEKVVSMYVCVCVCVCVYVCTYVYIYVTDKNIRMLGILIFIFQTEN